MDKFQGVRILDGAVIHRPSGKMTKVRGFVDGVFIRDLSEFWVVNVYGTGYIPTKYVQSHIRLLVSGYGFTRLQVMAARQLVQEFRSIATGKMNKYMKHALGIGKEHPQDTVAAAVIEEFGIDMIMEDIWN